MDANRILAAVIPGIFAGSVVYAATYQFERNEVPVLKAQLASSIVGLDQAIAIAEALVHGRATRAGIKDEAGLFAYQVEVLTGDRLFDVTVDSRSGKVLSSTADQVDRRGAGD